MIRVPHISDVRTLVIILVFASVFIISNMHSVKADCTSCIVGQVPKPVQLIQIAESSKYLYILWQGYNSNPQHNAIMLSTSEDEGSSFKIKDLSKFGIGSVDKMLASNQSLYLISKNTITESNDSGNSF